MKLDKYIKFIEFNFSYLFDRFEFKIVFKEQEEFDKLHVGLQSEKHNIKILFVKESGGGGVPLIGSPSASFYTIYGHGWIGLVPLLYYLGSKEINWGLSRNMTNEDNQANKDLTMISERLKPLIDKILEMFRSEDTLKQWKSSYNAFLDTLP